MYIITNKNKTVLYPGVTNDLERRMAEHIAGLVKSFAARYRLNRLLWFESCGDVIGAIAREKQIKGLRVNDVLGEGTRGRTAHLARR